MDLYLIRHADALPVGEQGATDDADRPLSAKGIAQTKALAATLERFGIRFDKVVTSPLLRARQTAESMASHMAGAVDVVYADALAFGGKRRRLARLVNKLDAESVALVGHQPDMGELAAWLVGRRGAQIEFAKAGIAYILNSVTMEKGSGSLVWLMTPECYMK